MKKLSPLEKDFYGGPVVLSRFWLTLARLETTLPVHGLQKYNRFQLIRLRYWNDGSVAHTYQEIADIVGSRPEYVRQLVVQGLRILRHTRYKLCDWL